MEVRLPLPDSHPLASRLTDICLISPRALEDSGIKIATFFLILPYRLPLSISRARDRCASLMVWRSLMINGTKRRDIEKENATL